MNLFNPPDAVDAASVSSPASAPAANSATLVAIAKDEARYIREWIAFHLAVGFDRIIVFDNDSQDETPAILTRVSTRDARVSTVDWPSREGVSPQVSAYNHALTLASTAWIAFLDVDEFLVPFDGDGIKPLLARLDADVASLHVNWRGFGSNDLAAPNYEFVTRAFTRCSPETWDNNRHYKTIARREAVVSVMIHDAETSGGRRVLSDLKPFDSVNSGIADRTIYDGIQINHYQCKTYPEFQARMRRGNAYYPAGDPTRARDDSIARFRQLDRNDEFDQTIRVYDAAFAREFRKINV